MNETAKPRNLLLNLLRGNFALLIPCFFTPWLELRCDSVAVKGAKERQMKALNAAMGLTEAVDGVPVPKSKSSGVLVARQTGVQVAFGGCSKDSPRNPLSSPLFYVAFGWIQVLTTTN